MRFGIDILIDDRRDLLKGKRLGVLANAASVNGDGKHTVDRILEASDLDLKTLFGPEHGISTSAQDMEPVASHTEPQSGIPIYSLYGSDIESLSPTPEMLSDIDLLIVDLPDVGSRYYTYVWTAVLAARACASSKKDVIICDRPNPIGGVQVEGAGIIKDYESFVGLFSIPVRHGMTIGEIVHFVNGREPFGLEPVIIPMEGWERRMNWPDLDLDWVNPSPNMRSYNAALLYPGMCLLEGTNVSEGRGTDTPFEIIGAPYIDTDDLMEAFEGLGLDGIHAAPTSFIPTRQKWKEKLCHGIRLVISDPDSFRPYLSGLALICMINKLYKGRGFEWRDAPYEFVTDKPAIDLLTGSPKFRENIDGLTVAGLHELITTPDALLEERASALLYK